MPQKINTVETFWGFVLKTDQCWIWTGEIIKSGYGRFSFKNKKTLAHRLAYELVVGPIPEGRELDHLCHSRDVSCLGGYECPHRRCVRPDHLEPVTSIENNHRGRNFQSAKTHCRNGHPYDEANTRYISGERRCHTCMRANARRQYHARIEYYRKDFRDRQRSRASLDHWMKDGEAKREQAR